MLQNPLSSTHPLSITGASWLRLGCTELTWPHRPCEQFLLCPVFLRLSQDLWSPFLSQLISPLWDFSKCGDLPSPSTSCQSCWSLFWFLFFSPLSSYPVTRGFFFVLLCVQSLSLMFSRCSERIVPFIHIFLIYLWGAVTPTSSCSTIFQFSVSLLP